MKRTCSVFAGVFLAILLLSAGLENAGLQKVPREIPAIGNSQRVSIDTDFGKMPLYFIPNQGQMDKQVAYYVQGKDKTLYFTPGGITLAMTKPAELNEGLERPDPQKINSRAWQRCSEEREGRVFALGRKA